MSDELTKEERAQMRGRLPPQSVLDGGSTEYEAERIAARALDEIDALEGEVEGLRERAQEAEAQQRAVEEYYKAEVEELSRYKAAAILWFDAGESVVVADSEGRILRRAVGEEAEVDSRLFISTLQEAQKSITRIRKAVGVEDTLTAKKVADAVEKVVAERDALRHRLGLDDWHASCDECGWLHKHVTGDEYECGNCGHVIEGGGRR